MKTVTINELEKLIEHKEFSWSEKNATPDRPYIFDVTDEQYHGWGDGFCEDCGADRLEDLIKIIDFAKDKLPAFKTAFIQFDRIGESSKEIILFMLKLAGVKQNDLTKNALSFRYDEMNAFWSIVKFLLTDCDFSIRFESLSLYGCFEQGEGVNYGFSAWNLPGFSFLVPYDYWVFVDDHPMRHFYIENSAIEARKNNNFETWYKGREHYLRCCGTNIVAPINDKEYLKEVEEYDEL